MQNEIRKIAHAQEVGTFMHPETKARKKQELAALHARKLERLRANPLLAIPKELRESLRELESAAIQDGVLKEIQDLKS